MDLFRTKHPPTRSRLRRSLHAFDLVLMGIGVIIGAGVFVITGVAAATKAGPAITLSFAVAGLASLFAALAYAELATSIGGCGSAYSYTYAGFGEMIAWIVGWNLLFEYLVATSTIAIGWSGYVDDMLPAIHIHLPAALTHNYFEGGIVNLPAVLILVILGGILCAGTRESARFNATLVVIKLMTIAFFSVVAAQHVKARYWHPFMPFGWQGVLQGAALIFYAYIGFDALSTAAEETIKPQRTLPIGIIVSLLICTLIYIIVAGLLTAIVYYPSLNVSAPVSRALIMTGHPKFAGIVAVGAITGLTTGMLIMYYGATRVAFAIARDGLLPGILSKVHNRTHTPVFNITFFGILMAIIAGFVPLGTAAELVNIGTLSVFTIVCAGVILLRILHPEMPRPFRLPFGPIIPLLGIIFCLLLMCNLPKLTWIRFILWIIVGMAIYFGFGYRHSRLNKQRKH